MRLDFKLRFLILFKEKIYFCCILFIDSAEYNTNIRLLGDFLYFLSVEIYQSYLEIEKKC